MNKKNKKTDMKKNEVSKYKYELYKIYQSLHTIIIYYIPLYYYSFYIMVEVRADTYETEQCKCQCEVKCLNP